MSNAFTTPSSEARTMICQVRTQPVKVRAASTAASTIEAACVAITIFRRSCRSAIAPVTGASRNTGICPQKPTVPRSTVDPVSWYTSQDCATDCIQVPINEIDCPAKNSR